MSAFTVTFSAFDRGNSRNLHFKMDGKRFKDDRTIKICRDVKYDVTVTVRPSIAPLEKLVIGGDNMTPDHINKKEEYTEYKFTWFTSGYTTTQTGKRHELRFSFLFEYGELAASFQVKFYPIQSSSHLTWGTEIHRIELEGRGDFGGGGGATGYASLAPTNISFK